LSDGDLGAVRKAKMAISQKIGRKKDAGLCRELRSNRPRQHHKPQGGSGDKTSPAGFLWRFLWRQEDLEEAVEADCRSSIRQDWKDSTRFADGSGKPTS
jgi:hypothetical protein